MKKIFVRYFIDFTEKQEKWLNDMADRGFRLLGCGKLMYTFEQCAPGEYQYRVEFAGDKSRAKNWRRKSASATARQSTVLRSCSRLDSSGNTTSVATTADTHDRKADNYDEYLLEGIIENCELHVFPDDEVDVFRNAVTRLFYSEVGLCCFSCHFLRFVNIMDAGGDLK